MSRWALLRTCVRVAATTDVSVCHRSCRIDQPPQRFSHRLQSHPLVLDVSGNIIDGARQDEDAVPNFVEFAPRYNQLVFGKLQFRGPLTGDPVPLSAGLTAKLARSTPALARRDGVSTPTALHGC